MKYLTVILISILLASCDFAGINLDQWIIDNIPKDTIIEPPQDSIILPDTCSSYEVITSPPFITGVMQFDVLPTDSTWYVNRTPYPSLSAALSSFPYPFAIYQSGINLSVIVDGTNNASLYQSRIWTRDGSGAKNYLSFGVQWFEFFGSMKFFEFMDELESHPSAKRIGFFNAGYSCEQVNEVIDWFKSNCIYGGGKTMDLRWVVSGCVIDPENIEYLNDANWTILQ